MSYVIIDTETTGLEDDAQVIQLAVLNPSGPDFNMRCKPSKKIMPSAIAVHGITNEVAADFPPKHRVKDAFDEYLQMRVPKNVIFVGQNIKFDVAKVQNSFNRPLSRLIDTKQMANRLIPYSEIGGYGLDALFCYLYPERLDELFEMRNKHDAMVDCELTHQVYLGLVQLAVAEVDPGLSSAAAVKEWLDHPAYIHAWPFGRHAGKTIEWTLANDPNYIWWFENKCEDPDPDVQFTIDCARRRGQGAK